MTNKFETSVNKVDKVSYEIRGKLLDKAKSIMATGEKVITLNIGNPFLFGFNPSATLVDAIAAELTQHFGYVDSKGLPKARQAILEYNQKLGIQDTDINHIYIGNGVSELILQVTQAILEYDEEILIPSPDYPLWTAATGLAGGKAVHYLCDEENNWNPVLSDIESKITSKTKAILIINPNNPTGAVYNKETLIGIVDIARRHNLLILSDEIYDRVLYDANKHISIASLAQDVLFITFNGLSKSYLLCGYRVGWMHLSGCVDKAQGLVASLDKLASMRLCSNVPMQAAIPIALKEDNTIFELTDPNGRLYCQKDLLEKRIRAIDGLSCSDIQGTLYSFVKFDTEKFTFKDDYDLVEKYLEEEKVLLVHGRGFNWPTPDHFRIVFLPNEEDLKTALDRLESFLDRYRK